MYLHGIAWGVPITMFGIIKLYGDLVGGNGARGLYNLIGDGSLLLRLGGVGSLACGIAL